MDCTSCSVGTMVNNILPIQQESYNYDIYNIISKYFNNIVMTKINNVNNLTVYRCDLSCLLCSEFHYLIAICPIDLNQINSTIKLKDLKWISFQTRTSYSEEFKSQQYTSIIDPMLSSQINMIKELKDRTVYICEKIPYIKIELLHKPKKMVTLYEQTFNNNQTQGYAQTGTLKTALDTFNCIINIE